MLSFFIGFVLLILLIGVVSYQREKKRTELLKSVANQLGMEFIEVDNKKEIFHQIEHLATFNVGYRQRLKNIFLGEQAGFKCLIFDYQYVVGSGKSQHTYHQTVVYFESDKFKFPKFFMREEDFFDKVKGAFGKKDIDFESHPDFSRKYFLKGEDEDAIRNLFTSKILNYFSVNLGWQVDAEESSLIIFKKGKKRKPEEISALLTKGLEIQKVLNES